MFCRIKSEKENKMQISRISMMNPYRTNSVAMKGRKEDEAAIRKFDEFMRQNDLVLTAVISPNKRLNDYTVCATLSKAEDEYGRRTNQNSPTPLIATDFISSEIQTFVLILP